MSLWMWFRDSAELIHNRRLHSYPMIRKPVIGVHVNFGDPSAASSNSFDPQKSNVPKRVQKGGSFLCTDQYCARYVPGARGKGDPDTATNHIGFRCVQSH